MILLDTSVWINLFSKSPKFQLKEDQLPQVLTCPFVIQEVLQGIKDDLVFRKLKDRFLAYPCLDADLPLERFLVASDLYRNARRQGITIRSSVDCVIAAIAIYHEVPVMHYDRDFDKLAQISSLQIKSLV